MLFRYFYLIFMLSAFAYLFLIFFYLLLHISFFVFLIINCCIYYCQLFLILTFIFPLLLHCYFLIFAFPVFLLSYFYSSHISFSYFLYIVTNIFYRVWDAFSCPNEIVAAYSCLSFPIYFFGH